MFLYKSVQIFGLSYKWTISPEKDFKEQQFKSYFSCDVSLLCSLASSYHYMKVKRSTLTRPMRCSSLSLSLQLCTTPLCQLCEQLLKMILVGLLLNLQ